MAKNVSVAGVRGSVASDFKTLLPTAPGLSIRNSVSIFALASALALSAAIHPAQAREDDLVVTGVLDAVSADLNGVDGGDGDAASGSDGGDGGIGGLGAAAGELADDKGAERDELRALEQVGKEDLVEQVVHEEARLRRQGARKEVGDVNWVLECDAQGVEGGRGD